MQRPLFNPDELLPHRTLKQLLAAKSHGVVSITPQESVFLALQTMAEDDVGALAVLDGGHLVGMISERDYARKVVLARKASMATPVSEIMTTHVVSVTPEQTVPECMRLMTEKRTRHLPVVEFGEVIGVLSIGDLLKEMLDHHERLLKKLAVERLFLVTADPSSY